MVSYFAITRIDYWRKTKWSRQSFSLRSWGDFIFFLVLTNGGKLYWYLPAQWLWWERDALTTGLSLHSRVWVPLTLYTSSPWIISLFIHLIESMLYNNLNKKTGNWEQHFTTDAFVLVVFNFSMVIWCCIWTLSFFSSFLIVVNCKKLSGFFDLLETSVVYLQ